MPTMTDFQWFTPVFTIFGGITIFIVSQIVLKLVIEPVQQLKSAIGLTANTLLRHRARLTNGIEDDDLSAKIYDHSADLISKSEIVCWYKVARPIFQLPSRNDVVQAARELNGIAHETRDKRPPGSYMAPLINPLAVRKNHQSLQEITRLLRVRTNYEL